MSVDLQPVAKKVRFYRGRNKLKDKTAGLGGGSDVIKLDEMALAKAEAIFQEMAEDYPDWVGGVLQNLAELHRRCVDTPEERRRLFEDITRIAHDLKGQGGTFGFPLISAFAASLNRFSTLRSNIQDAHVDIIKAHIDAMRAVIRERVRGDGGDIGKALAQGLETVIAKYRG
jgi:chemotaxis protein histidine kinase CheA